MNDVKTIEEIFYKQIKDLTMRTVTQQPVDEFSKWGFIIEK